MSTNSHREINAWIEEVKRELEHLPKIMVDERPFCQLILDHLKKEEEGARCYFFKWISENAKPLFSRNLTRKICFLTILTSCAISFREESINQATSWPFSPKLKAKKFLAGILEDLIFRYITKQIPPHHTKMVWETQQRVLANFFWGRSIENKDSYSIFSGEKLQDDLDEQVNINSIIAIVESSAADQFFPQMSLLRIHLVRSYLIGASIYEQNIRLLLKLHNRPEDDELIQFTSWYGLIQELINDLRPILWMKKDNSPTSEYLKKAQHRANFSDKKGKRLPFLPCLFYDKLRGENDPLQAKTLSALHKVGAIAHTIKFVNYMKNIAANSNNYVKYNHNIWGEEDLLQPETPIQ